MNAPHATATLPALGAAFAGGFFAGQIRHGSQTSALILAPKATGRHDDAPWNKSEKRVAGAESFCDGLANTEAMAAAGSKIAKWARSQEIAGFADWYIPSMDELELLYRAFRPTGEDNSLWNRSGLNASAVPPTYPYTAKLPGMTPIPEFQADGVEAFDEAWYWSSTQHAGGVAFAWCQTFANGSQDFNPKVNACRVVLVRRVAI